MSAISAATTADLLLARALEGASALVLSRVAEPGFADKIRAVFGAEADRKAVADWLSDFLVACKTPALAVVDDTALGGAHGAYEAAADTIYAARSFVLESAAAPDALVRVVLEELGHALDARLDHGDAPGDEGALFARLVLGEETDPAALAALATENDHRTIVIDGRQAEVELSAAYGTVTLDGALADWTAAERLDTAASGVAGYELYGQRVGDTFVFALKAPGPIGADTTFWLNTDLDKATGHQIWGFAGGSEYNVNFDSAGVPRLYSGEAGQTEIGGPLEHVFAADRTVVEFALPASLLAGSPEAVEVLADVNDSVFLPNDYSLYSYVVAAPAPPQPPPVTGDITIDGNLGEWTAAERLEVPGSGVEGYEVYGKLTGDAFVFALKATGEIGYGTTFWLNTDQNTATGHQIWGFAGGSEYNVNFTAKPALYTGADGETLVAGDLAHAFSADRSMVEFAVPVSQLAGAPSALDMLIDVNDSVFLPTDYSLYAYTVAGAKPVTPPPQHGGIAIDGDLADWTATQRIDLPGARVDGYEIYGNGVSDHYVIAIKSEMAIGPGTTLWLNTDQDAATGYQIWGFAGGAEYNINIGANGKAALYSGDAGETLVSADIPVALSADGKSLEIAVSKSLLGATGSIDIQVDVNDQIYLPADYGNAHSLRVTGPVAPAPEGGTKVAIVYSETTAAKFFDLTAYSQLFMAAQHQATMAGVPYDVLSESDLTDPAKLASYDTIVFPSFSHVPDGKLTAIENALKAAVYDHGVSLVTAGDFMTNDAAGAPLPGDSYARMKTLLGVTIAGFGTGDVVLAAADTSHPMMDGYTPLETIRSYANAGFLHYASVAGPAAVLAQQTVGGETHAAVLATETGAKHVHFSTVEVMADNNLLWQAIQWTANEGSIEVGLQLSRNAAIVAARNDMDQSQESYDVAPDSGPGIYDKLMPLLSAWKEKYDFVGSYYVNVGDNPPDQVTDWAVSAPYYRQLLEMGNEIGTHSYTHPHDTDALTPEQIRFEFDASQKVIEQRLGIEVTGAAVPGDPETLGTSREILQYFDYLTGGASLLGSGYAGAFGYLSPSDTGGVYLAPNMSFDFSLVDFLGMTPEQAAAAWIREWDALAAHAEVPVLLWPWHDYGPTQWMVDPPDPSHYTPEMYESFIAHAAKSGAEFVTLADLAKRIGSFEQSELRVATEGNVVTASVASADAGKFALDIDGGHTIQNVENWYAYDQDSVFLPKAGGEFRITLGAAQDDVTHIAGLPARAELLSLTGDGTNLAFSIVGDGRLFIELRAPAGQDVIVGGADVVGLVGERLELSLTGLGRHDVTITFAEPGAGQPPDIVSNGGGEMASVNVAENALAVATVMATDPDGGPLRYSIADGADAPRFMIDENTGALRFAAAPDYEAPADADGDNVYDVVVRATDSTGRFDSQALAVAVGDVAGVTRTGGLRNDTIEGSGEDDRLSDLWGNDTLRGLAGNDRLDGGFGNDVLIGGPGADILTGGSGRDRFVYQTMEDFGTLSSGDLITDFRSGQDRLDLSAIDANADAAGEQAFQFLAQQGAAFTGAGQVRFVHDAAAKVTFVEGNLDAGLAPDFRIALENIVPLKQTDLVL